MIENNKLETISNLFEGKEIRSIWNAEREEYYFNVTDVIKALTESPDPSHYWRTLKYRMIKEGNQTVTNCDTFKFKSKDGKMRDTDVLDTKGILRLIESVPSSKAEPFKIWLAKKHKPYGLKENKKVAKAGGEVVKTAREDLEQKLGETIISSNNNLNYQYIEESKKVYKTIESNN